MASKNSKAMAIAIVAGILLLIAGVSGLATWETIKDFVTTHIVDNSIAQIVFTILIFIASLGGIAVIAGGLLIGKNKIRTGRLFIALGAGIGLIGLIFSILVACLEENLTIGSFFSIGALGLILSIVARVGSIRRGADGTRYPATMRVGAWHASRQRGWPTSRLAPAQFLLFPFTSGSVLTSWSNFHPFPLMHRQGNGLPSGQRRKAQC